MKKILLIFILIFACSHTKAAFQNTDFNIPLVEAVHPSSDIKERNNKGNRSRHRKFECHINPETGISIKGINKDLIWSYELWSEDEESLLTAGDEFSFIEMLDSYSAGTYIILFRTDSYIYYGFITL